MHLHWYLECPSCTIKTFNLLLAFKLIQIVHLKINCSLWDPKKGVWKVFFLVTLIRLKSRQIVLQDYFSRKMDDFTSLFERGSAKSIDSDPYDSICLLMNNTCQSTSKGIKVKMRCIWTGQPTKGLWHFPSKVLIFETQVPFASSPIEYSSGV